MEDTLSSALDHERKYDWLVARDLYEQTLGEAVEKDYLKRGEVQEKIGHCLNRAAFQAESQEEFKARIGAAIEAYLRARDLYARFMDSQGTPRVLRCEATTKLLMHWITPGASGKLRLLDECIELEKKALMAFWDDGDKLEYGRTYNQLWEVFWHRFNRGEDVEVRKVTLADGVDWGEKAAKVFSEIGDQHEVAKTYLSLAFCFFEQRNLFIEDIEEQEKNDHKAIRYLTEALEISKRIGDDILSGWICCKLGLEESTTLMRGELERLEEGVKCGVKTLDRLIQGMGLSYSAYRMMWIAFGVEDPDQKRRLGEEAMRLYDRAVQHLSILSFYAYGTPVVSPPWGYVEYYFFVANWETDPAKKLELLDKAVEIGTVFLKATEEPHYLRWNFYHCLSKALASRAEIEPDIDKRKDLLQRAMKYREDQMSTAELLMPFGYWDRGVWNTYLAIIKALLAEIETDSCARKSLLEEAVSAQDKCLQLFYQATSVQQDIKRVAAISSREMYFATLLTKLYKLTQEQTQLRRAIEASRKAIISSVKLGHATRVAESYWKIAQAQDTLGEHAEAAISFQQASENYVKAAEKIPQLGDFYLDHASYMQAWGEIEEARRSHNQKGHEEAVEHFNKAAKILKGTTRWHQFASNYLAWAKLEEGEALSRREKTEEARDTFQKAADLFIEAKHEIVDKLAATPAGEERKNAEEITMVSDQRREYCLSRVILEDARISAGEGASTASVEKYGVAAGRLEKLMESIEQESDRRELRPIAGLCRAWEKMIQAEQKLSPSLYGEASQIFEQVVEYSPDQQTSLLAQANCYMCKALEEGMRFEVTKTLDLFSAAKKFLDAATTQYLRAGLRNMAEYSRATSKLLDAYLFMYQAQVDVDPLKRAQSFQMAVTMLQTSAGSYIKAQLPAKVEEVQRVLEIVREDREIAVSLSQVMKVPSIASATIGFAAPTQSYEQAVGLERFENADIQANLMPPNQEVKLGDTMRLKIDLVNSGRGGAQLIKIAELLPEGFELLEKPEMYHIEDAGLNMKGKNLGPLRTEEISLVLKPLEKGAFQIKPRILYLDEAGKFKSYEPDPAAIVVKELGISRWIKGPRG